MVDLDAFLTRCETFAKTAGISLSTVSNKLFDDGARLKNLRAGKDVGIRRLGRAVAALEALERQHAAKAASDAERIDTPLDGNGSVLPKRQKLASQDTQQKKTVETY